MLEMEEAQNVGELLRNTRLKKGKTLGDVSKDLCIRKFYLEAIENMDAANLPAMPYGLGFVRSYANYLELNASRITQAFRQAVYAASVEEKEEPDETPQTEYAGPNWHHVLIGLLGVVLIFAAWHGISAYNQQKQAAEEREIAQDNVVPEPVIIEENEPALPEMEEENTEAESETLSEESAAEPAENKIEAETADKISEKVKEEKVKNEKAKDEKNAKSLSENAEPKTAAETASVTPTKVQISFAGPSWMELKQGNKVLLSGIYSKGFKYDVPNEAGIIVSVGRYYNVDFYVDGKLTKVASAMKQTNISLDKYILPEQKQE